MFCVHGFKLSFSLLKNMTFFKRLHSVFWFYLFMTFLACWHSPVNEASRKILFPENLNRAKLLIMKLSPVCWVTFMYFFSNGRTVLAYLYISLPLFPHSEKKCVCPPEHQTPNMRLLPLSFSSNLLICFFLNVWLKGISWFTKFSFLWLQTSASNYSAFEQN